MDASHYIALKSKGKVALIKSPSQGAGVIQATFSVFDAVGNETVVVENITRAEVVAAKAALQTQVANLTTFIADLQAAP